MPQKYLLSPQIFENFQKFQKIENFWKIFKNPRWQVFLNPQKFARIFEAKNTCHRPQKSVLRIFGQKMTKNWSNLIIPRFTPGLTGIWGRGLKKCPKIDHFWPWPQLPARFLENRRFSRKLGPTKPCIPVGPRPTFRSASHQKITIFNPIKIWPEKAKGSDKMTGPGQNDQFLTKKVSKKDTFGPKLQFTVVCDQSLRECRLKIAILPRPITPCSFWPPKMTQK